MWLCHQLNASNQFYLDHSISPISLSLSLSLSPFFLSFSHTQSLAGGGGRGWVGQVLCHWATPAALFALGFFWIESHIFCVGQASDHKLPTYASLRAGITGMHCCAKLICWDGCSLTFCLGWPQTVIFLISASWVAGNTGLIHCIQKEIFF
jgi:hypothetical protein